MNRNKIRSSTGCAVFSEPYRQDEVLSSLSFFLIAYGTDCQLSVASGFLRFFPCPSACHPPYRSINGWCIPLLATRARISAFMTACPEPRGRMRYSTASFRPFSRDQPCRGLCLSKGDAEADEVISALNAVRACARNTPFAEVIITTPRTINNSINAGMWAASFIRRRMETSAHHSGGKPWAKASY